MYKKNYIQGPPQVRKRSILFIESQLMEGPKIFFNDLDVWKINHFLAPVCGTPVAPVA